MVKDFISLKEASSISGYHPDYLSALIRKGEIEGEKVGRNWVTTEEEIRNYIFKQKIRHKNWITKNFLFFFKKMNKSFLFAGVCLVIFSAGIYFYNQKSFNNKIQIQNQAKTENVEFSNIKTLSRVQQANDLKF